MIASELIAKLQEAIAVHGDKEVMIEDAEYLAYWATEGVKFVKKGTAMHPHAWQIKAFFEIAYGS